MAANFTLTRKEADQAAEALVQASGKCKDELGDMLIKVASLLQCADTIEIN